MQSLALLEELERLAGHDPVLEYLLQRNRLPTAKEYISLQWLGTPPPEIDDEEARVIEILKALEG